MDFTVELSKAYAVTPFVIMQEDKDYVIMMINYFIEKSESDTETNTAEKKAVKSDGFWDF